MTATQSQLAYRIIKWHDRHSNDAQRKSGGHWIADPTSFDSLGFKRLMSRPRGVEVFGVYRLVCAVAARSKVPGILANTDGPLAVDDLAMMTGAPVRVLSAGLDALCDAKIGWIDRVPWPYQWPHSEGCRPPEQQASAASVPPVALAVTGASSIPSGNRGFHADELRTNSGRTPDELRSVSARAPARSPAAAAAASSILEDEESSSSSTARTGGTGSTAVAECPLPDGVSGDGDSGNAAVFAILRRCGVGVATAHKLASDPSITPGMVLAHWADVAKDKSARNPGGVLGVRLASPADQRKALRLSTYAVREAVQLGIVQRLNGEPVAAHDVRADDAGVTVRGTRVENLWRAAWG